jgi:transposase
MVKKERHKQRDGSIRTFVRVVEGYRPGPGEAPKQRSVKSFGYLEEQDNPEEFLAMVEEFLAMVEEFNKRHMEEKPSPTVVIPGTRRMYDESNRTLNYGYRYLEHVYNLLEIDKFIERYKRKTKFKGKYPIAKIFKFLIFSRVLFPASKRGTFQKRDGFYGFDCNFELEDVYRALDVFSRFNVELEQYLNSKIVDLIGRDNEYAFYDVTNFFCHIDYEDEDGLRKRGVSKEHRVDPIVGFGLFLDSNGIPMKSDVFQGNKSESKTILPLLSEMKQAYKFKRMIVVADKGLNSSENIKKIVEKDDGYVFSQILRGTKGKRYYDKLFDENGWQYRDGGDYKYKIFTEDFEIGKNKTIKRKVLIYWDKKNADMMGHKREEKIKKALKAIKGNYFDIRKGIREYVKEELLDKKTKTKIKGVKKENILDLEKIEKQRLFDGYFCIVTSELSYDEKKIREVYHGLWKIEESFRILKSDIYARPIFLAKDNHVKGHFTVCYMALLIIRIIQYFMGGSAISTKRLATALKMATLKDRGAGILELDDVGGMIDFIEKKNKKTGKLVKTLKFSDKDQIVDDYAKIQKSFNTNLWNAAVRMEDFNKFLDNINITQQK